MMSEDFESYLTKMAAVTIPDKYGVPNPLFHSDDDDPISESDIIAAQWRVRASLPVSYKVFLHVLGPGSWCGGRDALRYWYEENCVLHPSEVFAFDEFSWEMRGFVAVVDNVRGVGDHIAFNPADLEVDEERPIYYCGHDPFGYARIADSFELWVRSIAEATLKGENFYEQFADAVGQKWAEYKASQPKKWWQLWR